MKCLLYYADKLHSFRSEELSAIVLESDLTGACLRSATEPAVDSMSPFLELELPLSVLDKILDRSVLVRAGYEVWARGTSYEDILSQLLARTDIGEVCLTETWSIRVESFGRKTTAAYARNVLDVREGQWKLPHDLSLKARKYIGNTSMDPVLSLLMANLARVRTGHLVLDPFAGTGSLLLAAARFGAMVFGTEIHFNTAHACGKSSRVDVQLRAEDESVLANFEQLGLQDRFLGYAVADASQSFWRSGCTFDAIITDPLSDKRAKRGSGYRVSAARRWMSAPYGLREKGSKLGARPFPDNWIAKVEEQYSPDVLPRHPCLSLVTSCEQLFQKRRGRWCVVMEKTRAPESGEKAFFKHDIYEEKSFRQKVMPNNC